MRLKLLRDRRGYSLTFWTVFFRFILIMAPGIELERYFYPHAEISKAAHAAALLQQRKSTSEYSKNDSAPQNREELSKNYCCISLTII
jgi:Flp pilus assembly protein TadG